MLNAAPCVDPRFALIFALGVELRLGQVSRLHLTDLFLDPIDGAPHGTFVVAGAGRKRGTRVAMTKRQRDALGMALSSTGYLHGLETAFRANEIANYPMFPSGRLPGWRMNKVSTHVRHASRRPVDRTTVRTWFDACEQAAGTA